MNKEEFDPDEIDDSEESENENINDESPEPGFDPECPESEEKDIKCEFEKRDGSWWCTTHNCWA